MANVTTLKTRLFNKYNQELSADTVLGPGEIHFVEVAIPLSDGTTTTAVLMKVGNGKTVYSELDFVAAKAADVYDWAKAAVKPNYEANEIINLDNFVNAQVKNTVDTINANITKLTNDLTAEASTARENEATNFSAIERIDALLKATIENDDDSAIDSIKELALWVAEHGEDAAELTAAINSLDEQINFEGKATDYVANQINALDLANTYDAIGSANNAETNAKAYAKTAMESANGYTDEVGSLVLQQAKEYTDAKEHKDTTYTAGNGLILNGTEFSFDPNWIFVLDGNA